MSTGIPATTMMTMRVGASSNQPAAPARHSGRFLVLVPVFGRGRHISHFRRGCCHSASSCEMHRVPDSTVPSRELGADSYYLIRVCSLLCSDCKAASGLVWPCSAVGGILDGQGDITVLDCLRPRLRPGST